MTELESGTIEALEEGLGYRFRDHDLLEEALTHRSQLPDDPVAVSYERLEFLGDAVLQLAVTRYLFEAYPDAAEGEMAKVRAAVVSETTLAQLAAGFGIADALILGKGEAQSGGRNKPSILSDVVESLLAVVFIESGFAVAEEVVRAHWCPLVDERATAPGLRDYKTRLQEHLARDELIPDYLVADSGPQHAKTFAATVSAGGEVLGQGSGTSKKRAEQAAAKAALERLAADA